MALLTSEHYGQIRAALDVELTEQDLPDDVIGMSIYLEAANADVLNRDPDAETRTGDDRARVVRAAIYFCAARLAPAIVRVTSLSVVTRDLSYQRATFDPMQRAADLRALAEKELSELLTPTATSYGRPVFFTRGPGDRGQ